jgi:hypothetical protein
MVNDSLKTVSGRVKPKRYRMEQIASTFLACRPTVTCCHGSRIGTYNAVVVLMTPDGRVWEHRGYIRTKGYVRINGETLSTGKFVLGGVVQVGNDGMPYIHYGGDGVRSVPLQEHLARRAHELLGG